MQKKCVCGNPIRITAQLCGECREIYGLVYSEWPSWLKEWLAAYQKELDHEKNHHDLTLYEETMLEKAKLKSCTQDSEVSDWQETEFDEWGNEAFVVDGFRYVDVDQVSKAEKEFENRLKYLTNLPPEKKARLRKAWGME